MGKEEFRKVDQGLNLEKKRRIKVIRRRVEKGKRGKKSQAISFCMIK